MSLVADLIAAGETLGEDAVKAIQANLDRESLAQHIADIANAVIGFTTREASKAEAVAAAVEPTPAPVVPVAESPTPA